MDFATHNELFQISETPTGCPTVSNKCIATKLILLCKCISPNEEKENDDENKVLIDIS